MYLPQSSASRSAFYERLRPHGLAPLWEVLASLVTPTPQTPAVFAKWSYRDIEPLLMEAGTLITAAEAERRVLILENPAFLGQSRITRTLYAGLQLILPGEVAPAHRHTQNALRFIMGGDGAFTALDGVRVPMHRHDVVLTPNWVWHDHGNDTSGPMIWLDGLDIPLIQSIDASFAEHRPDRQAMPTAPPNSSMPAFSYPYSAWRDRLASTQVDPPDPHHAYSIEIVRMTTIAAFARLVPAGFTTRPVRMSDGQVYVVIEGEGELAVERARIQLAPGDIFVVPPWAERRWSAARELVVFGYSDRALQDKLSLWREERL